MAQKSSKRVTGSIDKAPGETAGRKRTWTDDVLRIAVAEEASLRKVLARLGLREAGGNYRHVRERIKQLDLSTEHWHGQAHLRGKGNPHARPTPLDAILLKGTTYQSNKLRRRLLSAGILDHKCSRCELTEWLECSIPLELDHIDGDSSNNELSNLRLLCPNCHALTTTYRGRNIKTSRNPGRQAIQQGIARFGSQAAFAREIGVAPDTIRIWLKKV
jgi:5-methylcytosine-specific restriction endonuclease McrA